MSDPTQGPPRDGVPGNDNDKRSDLEQAVEARKDAVKRGEGGREPDTFTSAGSPDGVGGTGGVTKNQEDDAQ
ncbi:hypothetical protein [Sphingomonas sp.]|uniref:hypothetical protein n=1 Tax=Sphingomonas sp. TaxID=28214 RepID=UPI003D6CA2DE